VPDRTVPGPAILSRARRWCARVALLAVIATIALLGSANPAAAHGQLVFAEPAKDSAIAQPIDSIALYFTERPASNAFFTVVAPGGGRVDDGWSGGEPKRLDQPVQEYFLLNGAWEPRLYPTGFPILVRFAHWPAAGRYTISYLSVASDGEPVKGEVNLTYTGPTTPRPAGWQPPTSQPDPSLLAAAAGPGASAGAPGPPAPTATAPSGSGGSWWVWILPAALVTGVLVLVVRAGLAKPAGPRPSAGRSARPSSSGRQSPTRKKKPQSARR
jgi:methionine-rich copper-binding protein CopC